MRYKLARANSFKRSFKKRKLSDDEELAYIEVVSLRSHNFVGMNTRATIIKPTINLK
ncbi:MAG: hypothetical protein QM493_09455 [Sulfurovum sp.]